MHPLIGKAFQRIVVFSVYCLLVTWIFTIIERKDELAHERMKRMLKDLREEITFKYNMTDDDFHNFTVKAAAALSAGDKLDWTFPNSGSFVFAALTTVGKTPCDFTESALLLRWNLASHQGRFPCNQNTDIFETGTKKNNIFDILAWLRGLQEKLSSSFVSKSLQELRDKETLNTLQFRPESLGAM